MAGEEEGTGGEEGNAVSLSEDLSVAIVIVDTPERTEGFLPQLDELVTEGLVVLDDVQVVLRDVGRVAR